MTRLIRQPVSLFLSVGRVAAKNPSGLSRREPFRDAAWLVCSPAGRRLFALAPNAFHEPPRGRKSPM